MAVTTTSLAVKDGANVSQSLATSTDPAGVQSYAVTLVAALILGKVAFGNLGLVYPLVVPAIGVLTAIIGIFAVAPRAGDRSAGLGAACLLGCGAAAVASGAGGEPVAVVGIGEEPQP